MDIFRGSWSAFSDLRDSAVTVGSFDGVHVGHREVIARLVKTAREHDLRSVVITFETHPRDVMDSVDYPVPLLTTTEEKLDLLAETGVDLTMVLQFDHSLGELAPRDFVQVVLAGRIGMKKIVIGFNHAFGKGRQGDRESLIALSREIGFTVEVVNPTRIGDIIISSTKLRRMVIEGDLIGAAKGLNRYYTLSGTVIHGFGRGKRLGYPTANLGLIQSNKLPPKDGIYAGFGLLENGESYPAAISIGYNPTFGEGKHSLEAHLIGFDGDIYDQKLRLNFVQRIRGEEKYDAESELIRAIRKDIETISKLLKSRHHLLPDLNAVADSTKSKQE
ncbi:bifunctional riboflavin kinase/FAD synthetase [bacterium]|nr:MAG: bifunctional riboflavin kinase/FAD synthetase [bacterium]